MLYEIQSDVEEGLLSPSDRIKIVRGDRVGNRYYPIIDYYFPGERVNEEFEEMEVKNIIKEMEYYNQIIK